MFTALQICAKIIDFLAKKKGFALMANPFLILYDEVIILLHYLQLELQEHRQPS